ncbi:MAG TPA: hypothetical protein PLX50_04690 [Candidatus Aminicenantes bacterium]|nr:hypothetical protein [Candidatus Aminicenantes bacterium]
MQRRVIYWAAVLGGILISTAASIADDQTRFIQKKEFLEQELALAASPDCYFICDLREKRLVLKSNATILRTWEISGLRAWGKPVPLKTLPLVKKSTLNPPQRNLIKPGDKKEEGGAFELQALEIKDMPTSFRLDFEGDISLSVSSKKKGAWSRLARLGRALAWNIGMPFRTLRLVHEKKSQTTIDITLGEERDAQAVYWAFYDGIKGIFWYPIGG